MAAASRPRSGAGSRLQDPSASAGGEAAAAAEGAMSSAPASPPGSRGGDSSAARREAEVDGDPGSPSWLRWRSSWVRPSARLWLRLVCRLARLAWHCSSVCAALVSASLGLASSCSLTSLRLMLLALCTSCLACARGRGAGAGAGAAGRMW